MLAGLLLYMQAKLRVQSADTSSPDQTAHLQVQDDNTVLCADFTGDTYLRILEAAKQGAPDVHVHAFSPLEVRLELSGSS